MVSLADMSDAELGALVRRTFGESMLQKAINEREQDVKIIEERKKTIKRFTAERETRKTTPPLSAVLDLPSLDMSETEWDEVAPLDVSGHYSKTCRAAGREWGFTEDPTWRELAALHVTLRDAALDPTTPGTPEGIKADEEQERKIEALMSIANIGRAEALRRVLALK